jgi:uncharacterized RDD family membrane protein YckC
MSDSTRAASVTPADKGARAVGYLIDILPLLVVSLFSLIPFVGAILAGLLGLVYWLLRDIGGASLGKLAMGLRIASKHGGESTPGARVLRNITLAAPSAALAIPVAGYALGPSCGFLMVLIETIALLSTGERVGDRLADTVVVRR